jgi:hypothetical protein
MKPTMLSPGSGLQQRAIRTRIPSSPWTLIPEAPDRVILRRIFCSGFMVSAAFCRVVFLRRLSSGTTTSTTWMVAILP